MLPHVQPRSGGLAVPIAITGVASPTARVTLNSAATLAACPQTRALNHRKTFSRL